jgi:AraC-like DNA-binding protein
VFEPREPIRMVAVRFRPGGAIPFLRASADELTDRFVDAPDLGIRWLRPARFAEMSDVATAIRTLERALLDRLNAIQAPNGEIAYAVSALFGPTPPSVAELARHLGWSRQHLGRAMRRHVGVSAGRLGRIARLQKALTLLHDGHGVSLTAAALRAGYFDQAHMTRDFRALAGVTPRTAAAARGSIRPIPSLLGGA